MVQMINADVSAKTMAEFDYKGFRGTPYCTIFSNRALRKYRIYLLYTREKLYYPLAEWNEGDSETWERWYSYLCSIDDKIRKERELLGKQGISWSEFDKIEQIVPDEIKMLKDLKNDEWSRL